MKAKKHQQQPEGVVWWFYYLVAADVCVFTFSFKKILFAFKTLVVCPRYLSLDSSLSSLTSSNTTTDPIAFSYLPANAYPPSFKTVESSDETPFK